MGRFEKNNPPLKNRMPIHFDWTSLVVPESETESGVSSASSFSSAGHDGLTDAELSDLDDAPRATTAAPPPTPAQAADQQRKRSVSPPARGAR